MEICLCGSGKTPDQCCVPVSPPILMKIPPFISSSRIHKADYPIFVKQYRVRYSLKSGPGILAQVDPVIAEVLGFDMSKSHINNATERNTLVFPFHAVRYHQQQFMNRLRFIQRELSNLVESKTHDAMIEIIQCEDIPLRCEFEAYISRIASYLDAMAHYITKVLNISRKHSSHNKIQIYLENEFKGKKMTHQTLRQIYKNHENWSKNLFSIRHEIIHEGMSMDMTVPDDYFETKKAFNPTLKKESIEQLVVLFWNNIVELTRSIIEVTINCGENYPRGLT